MFLFILSSVCVVLALLFNWLHNILRKDFYFKISFLFFLFSCALIMFCILGAIELITK